MLSQVPAVHASARRAIETAKAALEFHSEGRGLIAATLVRSALECAITAIWLTQSNESPLGFVSEEYRQRRILAESMAKTASRALREGASRVAHADDSQIETIAAHQARWFQQRCLTLKGGQDAYTHYRILSALVHPSPTLADFYLDPDEDSPTGCALHAEPRAVGHDAWAFFAVACMVWANRAIDHLDSSHQQRSRLRDIARELGIPETLEMTAGARQAAIKSEQARRRAQLEGSPRALVKRSRAHTGMALQSSTHSTPIARATRSNRS